MVIENWEQYKDLEYYPDRFCACGCGGRIKVKPHHKYSGIPKFINGHSSRGRKVSKETIEKIRKANTDRVVSEETRKKQSTSHLGVKHPPERVEKNRQTSLAFWKDPVKREKAVKRMREVGKNLEHRRRIADACLLRWDDPEYKKKQLEAIFRGLKLLPNKPEKFLTKLLQELFPDQWKFVGDGTFWITSNGKHLNPDFIHVNQRKIIEHFGDFYHGEERTGVSNKQHEQERIDLFAQIGWKTLVIWEHELEDIRTVIEKVDVFAEVCC